MQKVKKNYAVQNPLKEICPSKRHTCCACITIIDNHHMHLCICMHRDVLILTTYTHHTDEWPCARILYTRGCYIHIHFQFDGYIVSTQVYWKPWIIRRCSDTKNEWFIEISTMTLLICIVANEHNRTYFYVTRNFIFSSASFFGHCYW